jgi:hypothetical protein
MKRIGTFSSAAGFIFLGAWMIISQRNALLGDMFFKWWPVVLIILGFELIFSFSNHEVNDRLKFNGLIVPLILIFLFVNVFRDIRFYVGEGFRTVRSKNFNEVIDILRNVDSQNYNIVKAEKILDSYGNNIILDIETGDIVVSKSTDGKIKLDADIYINKNSNDSYYEIKEKKESEGYKIVMDEGYIRKIKLNIYIPDGLNVKVEGNNLKLLSEQELVETRFSVDANNGSVNIDCGRSAMLKINNGKIDVKNVGELAVKSNNSMVNVSGNAEIINIQMNNGMVSINNKISKVVDIKMNSGTVKLNTDDQNVNVNLQIDHGPCTLNGEKRVNSGISKSFGSGQNKVDIDIDNGMITFFN